MATNLNYNVNVNATNGVQALNNLQNKVQGLNSAFAGLKNAIAGIAVGQIISNVLRFGDAIKDLSDATGIATTPHFTQRFMGARKQRTPMHAPGSSKAFPRNDRGKRMFYSLAMGCTRPS